MRSNAGPAARGFVLPTTLLVTTLLTVMLTAAFILVSAEHRTTDNSLAGARALSLAQAGLQTYFSANRNISATVTYDSLRYTMSDGYANVVARRLRPATGSSLAVWVVRASGFSTDARLGGQTQGKRVVAQLAQLNPGILPARAAMVAANGVQVYGGGSGGANANPLSGTNTTFSVAGCTPPSGMAADTFGVSTWQYTQNTGPYPQGEGPNGLNNLDSANAVIDSTRIDWTSLLAGNFAADYTIPPGPWPAPGGSSYLVGYVNGNVTIPSGGTRRGMLVVTGNVLLANNAHWDGIIISGGKLDPPSTAAYTIHGMVITGLNISQGQSVLPNQVRRGTARIIRWTWCYTQSSINSLSSMVPMRNAWVDTWTTY